MEGQRSISSSGKVASPGNALATDIDGQVEVHGQEILLVDRLELQLELRTCVCNIQRDAAVKLKATAATVRSRHARYKHSHDATRKKSLSFSTYVLAASCAAAR